MTVDPIGPSALMHSTAASGGLLGIVEVCQTATQRSHRLFRVRRQASMTTGTIIGRRRVRSLTKRPTA